MFWHRQLEYAKIYLCDVQSFFKNAEQFVKLGSEAKDALASVLCYHETNKGYLLVKPHSICNYLFFVEKGLTRTFYHKDDKDITDWLTPENNFACSIVSFINRVPDRRGIEALEDSILWSLEYSKLEQLYQSFHEIERLGRLIISSGLTMMQKRFDDLHFATALERYNTLMETYPTLVQRTPLGHIASYLGITQETLSRIRGQKGNTPH
jgi:signal-transduction protein with cAMP-binding, CBS, and nucleotidyltransferase domain